MAALGILPDRYEPALWGHICFIHEADAVAGYSEKVWLIEQARDFAELFTVQLSIELLTVTQNFPGVVRSHVGSLSLDHNPLRELSLSTVAPMEYAEFFGPASTNQPPVVQS